MLDRALAAAKFQGVGFGVAPVLVDLGEELGGLRQVAGELAEGLDLVAQDVVAEALAVEPVGLEVVDDATHGFGPQSGGNGLHGEAEAHDALAVVPTAQEHLVIGNLAAVDLAGVAIETEIGDPVMAAGVGAAAGLDGEAAHPRVVVLADGLLQRGAQVHGLGDAEIAGVGSGAGDHIVDLTGAAGAEAKFAQGGIDPRQARQRKVRQNDVLVDGGAQQAIAGGGGKPRQAAQLVAGEVALIDGHGDGGVPRLLLLLHVAGEPRMVGGVAGSRLVEHGEKGAVAERLRVGLVSAEALGHNRRPLDAAVLHDIVVLFGDLLLHPGEAAVAHHELHARGVLVLAVAVLIEDADDGFAPVEQALFGDELVEQLGLGRQRSQTAADDHAEASLAVANHGAEADVVDGALYAILVAAAVEGELEFARQVAGEVLAQEGVGEALGVGADVEDFVARNTGPGAGGDVADGVVAGLAVGEPDIGQEVHQVGDLVERDEVILDVLAGGEVTASAAELVGHARQLNHLARGEQPAGDFAAHHLDAGLTLSVDAMLQAKWTEVRLGNLPGQEGQCLGAESLNFLPNRYIVLILKLFPLTNGFFRDCCHNDLKSGRVQSPEYTDRKSTRLNSSHLVISYA